MTTTNEICNILRWCGWKVQVRAHDECYVAKAAKGGRIVVGNECGTLDMAVVCLALKVIDEDSEACRAFARNCLGRV